MRKMKTAASMVGIVVLGATMMFAQASRTWVSGVGDDANPCSRTAPCKTFAGAISKTAAGGEIDALDPAGYGALTITKAITIDGGGGQVASVLVSGTNGIVVQAGPSDVVILRNLRFNGIGTGINGIRFLAGKDLNVENCYVFGFTQNGLDVALNQATQASVHVLNSVFKNNGGSGIRAANAVTPAVQVGIHNTAVILDANGIEAAQHSRVLVSHAVIENASSSGVLADDASTNDAQLTIDYSDVGYNNNGLTAGPGTAAIAVSYSKIAFNSGAAFNQAGGNLSSYGNTNRVHSNGSTGTFTSIPLLP
jgi:Right handed beta helix region